MKSLVPSSVALLFFLFVGQSNAQWKPADGPLMTRWAKEVSPANVHAEYPRPQLVRGNWQNLNGLWQYAISLKDAPRPKQFDGQILVPFAVESALSGVKKTVGEKNALWYRRDFTATKPDRRGRVLLHFGAVDWRATVWVNGQKLGVHEGGYDPFSFDITDALNKGGKQQVVVRVWDPTNSGPQPRGKQVTKPGSIWYTSVTGIWQTVWLENVSPAHIDSLKIVPDVDRGIVRITPRVTNAQAADSIVLRVSPTADKPNEQSIATATCKPNETVEIKIKDARLWSPDHPHLYGLTATLTGRDRDSEPVDQVRSYFGMRKIALGKDSQGRVRLFLNNRPLFHFGPLDQGWWPDGLYTAPTDAALRFDIEMTKKLGFNMARKHVKVEPSRWYYHCDRLGLMVWQDMPSGDRHIGRKSADLERSPESAAIYRRELKAMIDTKHNHPCIVTWVPFNEGWGQFDTDKTLAWVKKYDPTRLVDGPSGWTDRGTGDIHDVHYYPGPGMAKLEAGRAVVLGEFGGLGLPVEGHLWWNKRNWGYRTYKTKSELNASYDVLMKKLRPLYANGLAGAIYTQTTDVEGEVNGLMTYDRKVVKFDIPHMHALHKRFYSAEEFDAKE